jgi:hypothetical protein
MTLLVIGLPALAVTSFLALGAICYAVHKYRIQSRIPKGDAEASPGNSRKLPGHDALPAPFLPVCHPTRRIRRGYTSRQNRRWHSRSMLIQNSLAIPCHDRSDLERQNLHSTTTTDCPGLLISHNISAPCHLGYLLPIWATTDGQNGVHQDGSPVNLGLSPAAATVGSYSESPESPERIPGRPDYHTFPVFRLVDNEYWMQRRPSVESA